MHPPTRRFVTTVVLATLSLSFSLRAAEPAALATPHKLGSMIFNWNQLVVEKKPTGERREVCEGTTPTLAQFRSHVTTLAPHSPWPATEVHTDEELVVIKEGALEYEINGRIQKATAGAVILITAGDVHRSHNAGDIPAIYYVFHVVTHEAQAAAAK
jgi:quercetin dioxygenase-like cupin family protein